jgi:hypothetical protein
MAQVLDAHHEVDLIGKVKEHNVCWTSPLATVGANAGVSTSSSLISIRSCL